MDYSTDLEFIRRDEGYPCSPRVSGASYISWKRSHVALTSSHERCRRGEVIFVGKKVPTYRLLNGEIKMEERFCTRPFLAAP